MRRAEILAMLRQSGASAGIAYTVDAAGDARVDANETMAFARQLEYFYAAPYETDYVLPKWRTLLPINTEVPSGAESHTFRILDEQGEVKLIDSYSKDFPRVEETGREFNQRTAGLGNGLFISVQDLRRAMMAKINIDARKARSARNIMERAADTYAAYGSTAVGWTGVFNNSDVPILNASSTTFGPQLNGAWATATAANIIADITAIGKQAFEQTKGVHGDPGMGPGMTLILPTKLYSLIRATPVSTTFLDKTIFDFVMQSNPFISKIDTWARADTAGPSSAQRIVAAEILPDNLEFVVPQDFEMLPLVQHGHGYSIDCHMRLGGLKVVRPLSMTYADAC